VPKWDHPLPVTPLTLSPINSASENPFTLAIIPTEEGDEEKYHKLQTRVHNKRNKKFLQDMRQKTQKIDFSRIIAGVCKACMVIVKLVVFNTKMW